MNKYALQNVYLLKDCRYGKYRYSCLEFIPIKHLSELLK